MHDFDQFERRLAAALRSDADQSTARFEPQRVARAAIASARGSDMRMPRRFSTPTTFTRLAAAAVIGALVVGGAFYLGLGGQPAVVGGPSQTPGASASPSEPASPSAGAAFWTTTASLPTPHYGHTATLLPDGKVLVAGGLIGNSGTASAWLYDPSTGAWTATGNMVEPRYFATATLLLNRKVLVAGGSPSEGGADRTTAELYDPSTGAWTATGNMVRSHALATATLLPSGKVLVAGGTDSTNRPGACCGGSATAELYDPGTGAWTATGDMITPRRDHTATLLPGGKVLVAGGYDDTFTVANGGPEIVASAELYDPGTGSWTATRHMTTPRVGQTATLLPDGKVLVAGGLQGSASSFDEVYDPPAASWTATIADPAGDAETATLLSDGTVLVAAAGRAAELYHPRTGSWTTTASGSTDVGTGTTATLLPDGTVLEVGGEGRGHDFASAELYHPGSGR